MVYGRNVVLIGMPASGKSSIGQHLARLLGWLFIDIDRVIEVKADASLPDLVGNLGTHRFLDLESSAIRGVNPIRPRVIATGGSAVHSQPAMAHLKTIGLVIYLHVELPVLIHRINSAQPRGIVFPNGSTTVEGLYKARQALYRAWADFTFEQMDHGIKACAEMIFLNLEYHFRRVPPA